MGHRFPYPSNYAQQNKNFIIQKNYRTTEDLTKKVVTSPVDNVDMQEKRKDAEYIFKKSHVKPINVTYEKSLQIIADMETPTNFRQDDYTITKKHNK